MAAGDANLLAYLEQTLAQLDAIAGEEDPETHATLDKLRDALQVGSSPRKRTAKSEAVAMDEEGLANLLESLDKQMGALETALEALPPDGAALLAAGMSAWQEGDRAEEPPANGAPAESGPQQAALPTAQGAVQPATVCEAEAAVAVTQAQAEESVEQASAKLGSLALSSANGGGT